MRPPINSDAPFEPCRQGDQSSKTTWHELGLPRALPKIPEPDKLPKATTRKAARRQVYDSLKEVRDRRIPIIRDDGERDTILGRVVTPDGLDDVMLTKRFVKHLISDHLDQTREEYANFILPSLRNPAEVWRQPRLVNGRTVHRQVFITAFEHRNTVVVQEHQCGNLSWTFFPAGRVNQHKKGHLLYRHSSRGS